MYSLNECNRYICTTSQVNEKQSILPLLRSLPHCTHAFFCQTIKGFWGPVLKSVTLYAPTKIKRVSKKPELMCAFVGVLGLTHNCAYKD